MSRNIENHDSVLLLQDCIAGCKMALESMDDIREHTDDKQLRELIDKYYDEHTRLSVDCRDMLDKAGADIKEPGVFAKMAAKLQTAMKMAVNDDQSQAAKLLTEGCNMGIETISGSLNEYRDADSKSVAIAERLRTLEEKMVGDLQRGFRSRSAMKSFIISWQLLLLSRKSIRHISYLIITVQKLMRLMHWYVHMGVMT